ncbi:3-oxoacyl-[acyl-carrier-protein] reductase [Mangrovivirga sp. M17]|uniref:3-oxoacyl-[acyl-carrier-protein] reductase n=1 Tax=Mangrovivirga halotolerans TaxID=2993936 RepID=A0ABT3RUD2_9BACT|nr:3-oxoacyl-[acyl-carrier-protein] reductase [Mangrovivirga halotolerans]MCX2745384.1 3-oxoacyl-[acyl-carrier-protein] reductase [Mangrovivirga halotolerans]
MKYALVTGGARGIGKAICLNLAEKGYNILINYNSSTTAAEELKAQIEKLGVKAELLQFDVSDREVTRKNIHSWFENHPDDKLEILVNNAGIRKDNLMLWMEDSEWDQVLNISLGGFYNVTKAALDTMIKNKGGRIINIVSLSGIKGLPGQTNYSAAKAAVIGATKSLAQEVGRRGITVNAVAPGFIKTDMTEDIDEKQYKSTIPLKRFGTSDEVAKLVGFLASEDASYITGEVISINGGLL